jgi:hypothetical protein
LWEGKILDIACEEALTANWAETLGFAMGERPAQEENMHMVALLMG